MATLKKHGAELARFEYVTHTLAVMEDGHVLRNDGHGWKCYRKAKPGITGAELARLRTESFNTRRAACPSHDAFVRGLCAAVDRRHRWMLAEAINLMPSDPDGVFCTLEDHNVNVDLDDIVNLCRLCEAGKLELQAYIDAKKAAK
jgi:hypothetical protein